jgi:hypothetical protein
MTAELDVVFPGSATIPRTPVARGCQIPEITADFAHTFRLLKTFKCDVCLPPHGPLFTMKEKSRCLEQGEMPSPFIDP